MTEYAAGKRKFVCPTCEREITMDTALRLEKVSSGQVLDEDSDLIRITFRCACQQDIQCAAYPWDLEALRRFFVGLETALIPWPRPNKVQNGFSVPIDKTSPTRSPAELLLERTKWELENTNTAHDALLFMRGPRQPEEHKYHQPPEDDE